MSWPVSPLGEVAEIRASGVSGSVAAKQFRSVRGREAAWIPGAAVPGKPRRGAPSDAAAELAPAEVFPATGIGEIRPAEGRGTEDGTAAALGNPLPAGTVHFSSRGRVGVAGVPAAVRPGTIGLVPSPALESRFLAWCLVHFREEMAALGGPGLLQGSTGAALGRLPIPLPPLAAQRRIAEALDRAHRLRQLCAQVVTMIDRLLPALFLARFGDPVFNRKRWPAERLGDLCEVIGGAPVRRRRKLDDLGRRRVSDSGSEESEPEPRDVLVAASDLSHLADWLVAEASPARAPVALPQASEGAVLLASRPPVGVAAIAGASVRLGHGVLGLVCGPRVDPWYLFAWCRLLGRRFRFIGAGTRLGQSPRQAIENLRVPVPPVDDQRRFRSVLEEVRLLRLGALAAEERHRDLAHLLARRTLSRAATQRR